MMKKITIFAFALFLMMQVFAVPSYVRFETSGLEPDRYSDGEEVLDGEVYACIWVAQGHSFAGLLADGSLVDPVNNRLIGAAPLAENGHCKPVYFLLDGENANLTTGTFEVYLLDTRIAPSQNDYIIPAGVSYASKNKLTCVNGWIRSDDSSTSAKNKGAIKSEGFNTDGSSANVFAAGLPNDLPKPVIKSIQVKGGSVVLTISKTVPYMFYGISSGETPSKLVKNFEVPGASGTNDGGDLTLVVKDPDKHKFFKVFCE